MEANKRALRCAELSPQSTNFFGRMQTLIGLGMGQKWFWSLPIKTYSFCFLYVALFCLLHNFTVEWLAGLTQDYIHFSLF